LRQHGAFRRWRAEEEAGSWENVLAHVLTGDCVANCRGAAPGAGDFLFAVRRETGKEYMVQVHCSEGVAIRIGPEPCAITRKDGGEASAGGRAGQPLSRERKVIPGADAVAKAEGHTSGRAIASACKTRRGRRTWHARTLLAREPGDLLLGHRVAVVARIGKARSRSR